MKFYVKNELKGAWLYVGAWLLNRGEEYGAKVGGVNFTDKFRQGKRTKGLDSVD